MSQGARIHSVDALSIFRAALIKFAESANVALTSADGDIDRVLGWLERDQTVYWAGQVRKRHEIVLKWEDAVRQKRLYKNIDGTAKSAVDEQKELQRAKRAEDEARMKEVVVKKAITTLRKESLMYKGRVMRLATFLQSDIPAAVRSLDAMLMHIDSYLQVQTTGQGVGLGDEPAEISREGVSEKVGLERFRAISPKPEDRQTAVLVRIAVEHPMNQPWKAALMQEWQTKSIAALAIEPQMPDLEARVVLHPSVWTCDRIYLERLAPASEQDSGWYIGAAPEEIQTVEPAKLMAVRLGDLIAARPDFLQLLGLPARTLIILDAGGPAAIFDGLGLDIWALALIKAAEPARLRPESSAQIASAERPAT